MSRSRRDPPASPDIEGVVQACRRAVKSLLRLDFSLARARRLVELIELNVSFLVLHASSRVMNGCRFDDFVVVVVFFPWWLGLVDSVGT